MAATAVSAALRLRVTFGDSWATHEIAARADESIASVKARVLALGRTAQATADGYEVKHGGVPVRDESRSLLALGIKTGAAMIVQAKRRRPVR